MPQAETREQDHARGEVTSREEVLAEFGSARVPASPGEYRLRFHDYGQILFVTAVEHSREAYR
jgi:hypothetical protein